MRRPTAPRVAVRRAMAVATLIALLAIAGSGCGGGGSTVSTSTSGGSATSTSTSGNSPSANGSGSTAPSPTTSGGASQGGRTSGGKQSGEGGRPYRGGEKSIEEFGSEAEGSSRSAVLGVFTGYLNALATKDYGVACSHLAATVQRSLEQFVASRLKAKGCAAILPKLLAPTAAAIAREQAEGRITKVRVQGDRGFVVFHAPGAKLYQLTMVREGGEWKAATVAASVLVPSLATLGQ